MTDRREQDQYLQRLRDQQRHGEPFQPQHLRQYHHPHLDRHQHHHQHFEHPAMQQIPRQFHNRHFQNPYDGMNNFYRDSWQDNYYHNRHQHHHRHHRDRDDFIPRMLEGILGEIMDGSLFRELDKLKVDGKQSKAAEDFDNDRLERAAFKEDKSPDRQASENLDFSPQGQTSGVDHRFERTG